MRCCSEEVRSNVPLDPFKPDAIYPNYPHAWSSLLTCIWCPCIAARRDGTADSGNVRDESIATENNLGTV